MLYLLLYLGCDTPPKTEASPTRETASASDTASTTTPPMSALEFATICKQELGLPNTPLPPMRCTDGLEVPITVHGEAVSGDIYTALSNGEIGCDTPSWINSEEPCATYSFVSRFELSDSVTGMLFCRKRNFSNELDFEGRLAAYSESPSQSRFEDLYYFDTVGLIWTNHQTGKSCFFDNQHPNFYAGLIPSPDDPNPLSVDDFPEPKPSEAQLAEFQKGNELDIWRLPIYTKLHARCYRCHDSDPFIRSPHLRDLGLIPPHQPHVPYQMILPEIGNNIELAETIAISTTPVQTENGEEAQLCTQCHNIGSMNSCSQFINYYTGTLAPNQNTALSPHDLVLMPPPSEAQQAMSESDFIADWTERVQPHLDKLTCCCDNPNAIGCTQRDLRYDDMNTYTLGLGPETCE